MARNKYPEKTVEQILEAAAKLFTEKGYEQTTILDIVGGMQGLTRGAFYHHFKSKEEVFDALIAQANESNAEFYNTIKNNATLTGAQKLKEIVRLSVLSKASEEALKVSPNLLEMPKFLATQMKQLIEVVTPQYIAPIILDGVNDGSITTNTPYELAELIGMFINVWLNPAVFGSDRQSRVAKCKMINECMSQYGFFLFDDEMIVKLSDF